MVGGEKADSISAFGITTGAKNFTNKFPNNSEVRASLSFRFRSRGEHLSLSWFFLDFNMFKSDPFPCRGGKFARLVEDLRHLAYSNYRSLEAQAQEMEPVRWRDELSASQNRLFSFISKEEDWIPSGAEEDLHAAVQQVPLLFLSLTRNEGELTHITLGTYHGRVVTFSIAPLAATGTWFRLWDVLPEAVRGWLQDEETFVVLSPLWRREDGEAEGIQLRNTVSTEALFALYQYLGLIRPLFKADRGTLDWQMAYAINYHHLPTSRPRLEHLIGEAKYGRRWPEHRSPGWRPHRAEDPTEQERFVHYYNVAGMVLFINRLLRHGIVYGGMKSVVPNNPLGHLFTTFLQGGKPQPQHQDPLRLRHDWPSPRHYRGNPALQLYGPPSPGKVEVTSTSPRTPPQQAAAAGEKQEKEEEEASEELLLLDDEALQEELEDGEVVAGEGGSASVPMEVAPASEATEPALGATAEQGQHSEVQKKLLLLAQRVAEAPTKKKKPPTPKNKSKKNRRHTVKVWDAPPPQVQQSQVPPRPHRRGHRRCGGTRPLGSSRLRRRCCCRPPPPPPRRGWSPSSLRSRSPPPRDCSSPCRRRCRRRPRRKGEKKPPPRGWRPRGDLAPQPLPLGPTSAQTTEPSNARSWRMRPILPLETAALTSQCARATTTCATSRRQAEECRHRPWGCCMRPWNPPEKENFPRSTATIWTTSSSAPSRGKRTPSCSSRSSSPGACSAAIIIAPDSSPAPSTLIARSTVSRCSLHPPEGCASTVAAWHRTSTTPVSAPTCTGGSPSAAAGGTTPSTSATCRTSPSWRG